MSDLLATVAQQHCSVSVADRTIAARDSMAGRGRRRRRRTSTLGQLGRYRLIQSLGVGGHGRGVQGAATPVRAASNGRWWSSGSCRPTARTPEFARMFTAEAKILGMLHHPNVVQAYDFGERRRHAVPGARVRRRTVAGPPVAGDAERPSVRSRWRSRRTSRASVCRALDYVHHLRDQRRRASERDPPRRDAVEHRPDLDRLAEVARLRHREVRIVRGRRPDTRRSRGSRRISPPRPSRGAASTRGSICSRVGVVLHEILTLVPAVRRRDTTWRSCTKCWR